MNRQELDRFNELYLFDRKEYRKAYYEKYREEFLTYYKRWYRENKEDHNRWCKRYYQTNREIILFHKRRIYYFMKKGFLNKYVKHHKWLE